MKQFAIIGGGISGLAALHYIKQRFGDKAGVKLYERGPAVGGVVSSQDLAGHIFETGANGFLSNQSNTLEFIKEVGFENEIIGVTDNSSRRYIQLGGKLQLLPMNPMQFLKSPLLTPGDKLRFFQGFFGHKNLSKDQSIYDYISKRFGTAVAERLVDPFLTGIYAGDIKQLHMQAFPKMASAKGAPKPQTCSFKRGMGSLISHLYDKYKSDIELNREIKSLDEIKADEVICTVPAYTAAGLLNLDLLNRIYYAPVAVVGLVMKKSGFKSLPDGFGYLVPSSEGKEILGVLIESNVFERPANSDDVLVRIMLGGSHHPTIGRYRPEEILAKATAEIARTYSFTGSPVASTVKIWPKAIPQYDLNYPAIRKELAEHLAGRPHLHLCASYLDGVSFNDCINNARKLVSSLS